MADTKLIGQVRLGSSHSPIGRTRHYGMGTLLPRPTELRIIQYANDPGFYLLYIDEAGKEMTDTYFDTLRAAIEQAEWEFEVTPAEWQTVAE